MVVSLKTKKQNQHMTPIIPLLGIYPKKPVTQKDTCTPMFTAVLFTLVRTCKQPKWPMTDKWRKKMCYMYTVKYDTATEKNAIELFVEM